MTPELEAKIRARAYQFYVDEGHPDGRHHMHWQRAHDEIMGAVTAIAEPIMKMAAKLKASVAMQPASDVSLIDGVGPKITGQLHAAGITSLPQIAAMTESDMAALDARLNLKGRTARDGWIAQARELVAGAVPQAKSNQTRAGKTSH